jgi:hypothetical protein
MAKTNIDLLKQIFWELYKEKRIVVDITKTNILDNGKDIALVDFNDFDVLFYKNKGEISIISK